MFKSLTHACNPKTDKYCSEGAAPARHDDSLPAEHSSQHGSHRDGCVCPKGNWINLDGRVEIVHIK